MLAETWNSCLKTQSSSPFIPPSATSAFEVKLLRGSPKVEEGTVLCLESGAAGARRNVFFLLVSLPPWCSAQPGLFPLNMSYSCLNSEISFTSSLALLTCVAFGVIREKILCPFTITGFWNIKMSRCIGTVILIGILTFD